ncbi:hypothetical protein EVAR_73877_1 [Eumeta japonica]|uniref:Uncharacterized protein n=1 Tax=Eumeta variegata TaxID=151549 RepID=A0A4C1TTU5_EUMVA|nr:hypothetical protein EVAR_73877_1 [Eumeta japonica]
MVPKWFYLPSHGNFKRKIAADEASTSSPVHTCVHGIREHGEKRLQAAADLTSGHITNNEMDKSEDEEDVSRAVIDTTADEEDSCSSMELCTRSL